MLGKIKKVLSLIRPVLRQKGIGRKKHWLHYAWLAYKNGVVPFRIDRIASEYTDDYYADTGIPRPEKEWYYCKGLTSFKINFYGLNTENYNNFISDFDFYNKKNYQNKSFENWFEHKLNTYYLLLKFQKYLPKHYFYKKDMIYSLEAGIKGKMTDSHDVLTQCRDNPLAFKACIGGHGKGFYKLEHDGGYVLNGRKVEEHDVEKLVESLNDYIITEYCVPHKVFRKACGENAFAVIRAVTVFDQIDGPQITAMIIRLGMAGKVVCDYDGTIYCGVDLETGRLFNPVLRTGDEAGVIYGKSISTHPETGHCLEGISIPNFQELKSLLREVSAFIPMTPYLVFDIIPVDEGFKILEINSHGQVRIIEPFYPFRSNPYNLKVFATKDR